MKFAVAQISCVVGEVAANVAKFAALAAQAKAAGAEWLLLPEMADTGYVMRVIRERAQPWTSGAVPELQRLAREHSLGIVAGVSERTAEAIYNTQVAIDPQGEIRGRYRKTHLFAPPPIEEQRCFAPGGELVALDAGPFRFGLGICYDLRFPEFHRTLACVHGANVLLVSSAWPFPRVEHLRTLATARAIENQSYVLLSNRVGTDDGVTFCGSSAIIDPAGTLVAAASPEREELLVATLSAERSAQVRAAMPVFEHRRPELYR